MAKQRSAYVAVEGPSTARLWQEGYHDYSSVADESITHVIFYVLE